jgi:hypothetical protein
MRGGRSVGLSLERKAIISRSEMTTLERDDYT